MGLEAVPLVLILICPLKISPDLKKRVSPACWVIPDNELNANGLAADEFVKFVLVPEVEK
jgi:hypothetical protein